MLEAVEETFEDANYQRFILVRMVYVNTQNGRRQITAGLLGKKKIVPLTGDVH